MDKADYRFQALLYTLALERLLQQSLAGYRRERDLGDCWYVFIRAVGLRPGLSPPAGVWHRSEEHTSELQSLMRISYAVFCLKKTHINIFIVMINMTHIIGI